MGREIDVRYSDTRQNKVIDEQIKKRKHQPTGKQADTRTGRQIQRQKHRQKHGQTDRYKDRHTQRQTDKHTGRQADRQTHRHTRTHRQITHLEFWQNMGDH